MARGICFNMSCTIEIYYERPRDLAKNESLTRRITELGGCFESCDESFIPNVCNYVQLGFEFSDWDKAVRAVGILRKEGCHVEGPYDYCD